MKRVLLICALAACGKGGKAGDKGDGSAAGGPREDLLAAWKSAGLAPAGFAAAKDSPVGKDCQLGTVNSVEVLVCSFTSADEAKAAQDTGLKWVGDTTGISTPKGTLLIVAADRKKADPTGSTINKLMK